MCDFPILLVIDVKQIIVKGVLMKKAVYRSSLTKTACLTLVVVLALVLPGSMKGGSISKKEQAEIIDKISSFLINNYVSPETGARASEVLLTNHREGKYSEMRSAQEFAAQLDTDLQEWSNDKHLGVIYDPDWVKQMKETGAEDEYLTEEMIAEERARNFGFKRCEVLDGNVGFLDIRIFFHPKYAGATAVAAMNLLSDCEAVIIDLRNNGGGWGNMVSFLCSYFLDNEECVHLNSVYSRPEDQYYQSWTAPYVPGRIMADIPLYILTSRSTFSAAEEFCYNLKFLKRAMIVGERTRGGAHPISSKVLSDELILIVPEMTSVHPVTKANWEGVGVEPDIPATAGDAFNVAYLDALEKLRSAAQGSKKALLQWYVDGFKAGQNPVVVKAEILQSYVGVYGALNIRFEDGVLTYQRGDRRTYRMIPMSETLFLVDDQSDIRIRFKREKEQVTGLLALYSDGNSAEYVRNE